MIPPLRFNARQLLLTRGLMPMLSAPPSDDGLGGGDPKGGDNGMLEQSIKLAARQGLVKADDHVVCVQVGGVLLLLLPPCGFDERLARREAVAFSIVNGYECTLKLFNINCMYNLMVQLWRCY